MQSISTAHILTIQSCHFHGNHDVLMLMTMEAIQLRRYLKLQCNAEEEEACDADADAAADDADVDGNPIRKEADAVKMRAFH